MSDRKLPLLAETLITMAAIKLIESRRNFKSRQVLEALDCLCATLVEYGSVGGWPPSMTTILHDHAKLSKSPNYGEDLSDRDKLSRAVRGT